MAKRKRFQRLDEALAVARDNTEAIRRLNLLGRGNVVVAEVLEVDGVFELQWVAVRSERNWQTSPRQHIVRIFLAGPLSCPACRMIGTIDGEFKAGDVKVPIVNGLNPKTCPSCHDIITQNGITPTDFSSDPPSNIPRP